MIEKKSTERSKTATVKFSLPGGAAQKSVAVVGDFNDWDVTKHLMKFSKKENVWSVKVSLPRNNSYQFRYFVDDNRWLNDDEADGVASTPFHSENSVINV